jgi:hypothetical protein
MKRTTQPASSPLPLHDVADVYAAGTSRHHPQRHSGGSAAAAAAGAAAAAAAHTLAAQKQTQAGAQQLLLQEVPLYLRPPVQTNDDSAAALPPPVSPDLLQLRRLWVRTPPRPFALVASPRVRLPLEPEHGVQGSAHTAEVDFTCGEVTLPPNALVALCLPRVYAVPLGWVSRAAPAAAAALEAAGLLLSGTGAAACTSDAGTPLVPMLPCSVPGHTTSPDGARSGWLGGTLLPWLRPADLPR